MFEHLELVDCVDSTNDYLKSFIPESQPRLVVAREQTSGRGQFGRSWYSPRDLGLYVSYLFFPDWTDCPRDCVNPVSSLAVLRAIREFSGSPEIVSLKAPNDVLVRGKKTGGILSEVGTQLGHSNWVIIGIGINLYQVEFPPELRGAATSLRLEGIEVPHPLDLCAVVTRELEVNIECVRVGLWRSIEKEYRRESL